MKASHPNKWAYGGVIVRIAWIGDPGEVRRWDGADERVEDGDRVLVLVTGQATRIVGVER